MIRYTVQGDAQFQKMLQHLTQFPKLLDSRIAPGLRRTLKVAKDEIMKRYPNKTGRALDYLDSVVLGYGRSITGVAGFKGGKDAPWYVNIVEHGARKHSLAPTGRRKNSGSVQQRARAEKRLEKQLAAGKSIKGTHIFVNGEWRTITIHPGFSRRGFMAAGFAAALPVYEAEMQKAVQGAFDEVTKK